MKIIEENRDILTVDDSEYYLVQFISADFAKSTGIIKEYNKYNTKLNCILCDNRVFNLIIKKNYYQKPTYESIKELFINMKKMLLDKDHMYEIKTNKIAIPNYSLYKLDWNKVQLIIEDVFKDTNVEILICNK